MSSALPPKPLKVADPANANPASAAPVAPPPHLQYAWQRCLNVADSTYAGDYHTYFNPDLLNLFAHAPRTLLDIGCASGVLCSVVKERHPASHTIGIEPNKRAADLARSRVDQVFTGTFEEVDLVAEGITHGSIDSVVAADVLEHMYDPWRTLVNLKPFLTKDAQVIISIPNSRHVNLIARLADGGMWTYEDRGLLDITHIRFFTLKEFAGLLEQTGYRLERVDHFIDPSLLEFFNAAKKGPEINLRVGRIAFERLTLQDLTELCTWQFFNRARPI
jgi:O-antigen biosynthesis protein